MAPVGKKACCLASALAQILCLYQGARSGVGALPDLGWPLGSAGYLLCGLGKVTRPLSLRRLVWTMGIVKCFLKVFRRMAGDSKCREPGTALGTQEVLSGQELPLSSPSL